MRTKLLVALGLMLVTTLLRAETGVTDARILLGQSAAFSGPAADLGKEMRLGAMAYFDFINAQGGVFGRKIEIQSLDDGYEPDRAVANTRKLISKDRVFALFGYVGTPTSYAVMPLVSAAKIPFFAPFTGADRLRTPVNHYIFNIRASYADETARLVDWAVAHDRKNIAVFYQNDAYGQAGLQGVEQAMQRHKLRISARGTVERNTIDVATAVRTIAKARPQAVIMISAYKSCAEFIRQALQAGMDPVFMNVSFVGSAALAAQLGADGNGVIISQVVPFPWDPTFAITREFTKRLSRYAPEAKPSFNNLEGYIAAKAFIAALQKAGRDLTREKLIHALETFQHSNLGDWYMSFSPTNHQGTNKVQLTIIIGGNGGFMYLD